MRFPTLSISLSLFCLALVAACGGSSGGDSPPDSSSSSSSSTSSSSSSSSSDGIDDPSAMPIQSTTTLMGGTYAADGTARVLVYDADEQAFVANNEDRDGLTLYTFDNDSPGASACNSQSCVEAWPPLLTTEDSMIEAPFSTVERDDGSTQWALRGEPLYFFRGDEEPGDINGEGVNDVWRVAVTEPARLNDLPNNTGEGQFFVATGEVLVSAPETEGETDSFVAETQDRHGFTLYTFANDEPGTSNCTGNCLANWPALLANEHDVAEPPFSLIERTMDSGEGTAMQWAYQGMPLYFFVNDESAGDISGASIPNWNLARPLPWFVRDTERGSALAGAGMTLQATPDNGGEATEGVPAHGMTLYTFDNDDPGASNCTEGCLANWPALMAHEGAEAQAPFSLVERGSGELQWALHDMPLYFFVNDSAPGDVVGDEVNGVWHIARTPPVDVNTHPEEGELFVASGNLVDANGDPDNQHQGFTLYTFEEDTDGTSNCGSDCLSIWPAFYAPEDARDFGDFTVLERGDGDHQWRYRNQPLYFYVGDSEPGDANGEFTDSFGTWLIARPGE